MTTKVPAGLQWGMPTVYNTNHVNHAEWASLDKHTAYQSTVRQLQVPAHIGEPIASGYGSSGMNPIAIRVPPFTTGIIISALATGNGNAAGAYVQYNYSDDLGTTWYPALLYGRLVCPNAGADIDQCIWVSTKLEDKDDAATSLEPWPIPVAWQAEEQEIWIDMNIVAGTLYSIWYQPLTESNAEIA